jgi:sulfate/thiosulfate transport system substrate-binding protein
MIIKTPALNVFALALVALATGVIAWRNVERGASVQLLNVSYDPTRELYQQVNPLFVANYEHATNARVAIKQSHAGSSHQARSVINGEQAADVVTLGLVSDIDGLQKRGLIGADWADRLPNRAQPYYSTIVFVVRRGNPHKLHDWPDLIKPGVEVITPDPLSSGNGKLVALAAWGAIVTRGGNEAEARSYLKALYDHAPFLEAGARATGLAFAIEKLGDVQLAWENEALREVGESKGELAIVPPPISILAEPVVAWVDRNVAAHHTEAAARAYLEFLFTPEAQEVIARNGYRPSDPKILAKYTDRFAQANLFPITAIARDWDDAQQRFFAEDGIINTVYRPKPR